MGRQQPWVTTLRASLKQEHGFGWGVREKHGKVQLTRRFEDGSRSSITLHTPWDTRCLSEVMALVSDVKDRMDKQQMSLREAYNLVHQSTGTQKQQLNWAEAAERFRRHKVDLTGETSAETFRRMYQPVIREILLVMEEKPKPTDGKQVLIRVCNRDPNPPGTRWRRIKMQNGAQLLKFAVNELGAPDRWMPPADVSALAGKASAENASQSSTPIKDAQLIEVLADIPDSRWRDAVSLVACFGLRPVELRYHRPQGKFLYVSYRKRTARGMTDPGEVVGLDPIGMSGESERLLTALQSNQIVLPPLGSTQGETAESLDQYLSRRSAWKLLKAKIAVEGGRLTPYSLRHGYALRAHETYKLSVRVTAKMMRHSVETHCRHYGSWVDREILEKAYEASTRPEQPLDKPLL